MSLPGPRVVKSISVISAIPTEPVSPTLMATVGRLWSSNNFPLAIIVDQASPTILDPAGKVIVEVIMYVPASKNMILSWAY